MAQSPSHKFGQIIGDILELVLEKDLKKVCEERNLYLDIVGKSRAARPGKKISWYDNFGNKHDLDVVIERNATESKIGEPVAFIESAWRRYTKHSKNKAQEIQAALLPIADAYTEYKPFLGVILAGVYTTPSIEQLKSNGFEVLYLSYEMIIKAFKSVGIDAFYDESTPTNDFEEKIRLYNLLDEKGINSIIETLMAISKNEINLFTKSLIHSLDRRISTITITPLFGKTFKYNNIKSALEALNDFDTTKTIDHGTFEKFEISVRYTNGDNINGQFIQKDRAIDFLKIVEQE